MKLITRALNKLGLFTRAQYRASTHEAERLRGDILRIEDRLALHNGAGVASITRQQQIAALNGGIDAGFSMYRLKPGDYRWNS